MINGDKERLSRAIRNIIDNVIKHALEGKYIGFLLNKNEENIILTIKDHGKGIDINEKEKIFDRFYRNSKNGGMGLGLAITKEIIEKHKGKIDFFTNPENGSSFIVNLPV
jgi:signal transduction histidine kinase